MKHLLISLSLVLGIMFVAPTPVAHAWSWGSFWAKVRAKRAEKASTRSAKARNWSWSQSDKGRSGGNSTPELDPGAAGGAMVLLLGGVAYVMSRRREEEDAA